MKITSTTGAVQLVHDGQVFEPLSDTGVFELPDELAAHLVRFPHWRAHDPELDDYEAAHGEADEEPTPTPRTRRSRKS